ncbi:MAG: Hpt domain-containing protein [Acidobacteria bacterium]|nr:Hpt domain-containing protein [Acidobacteriota bacterium]
MVKPALDLAVVKRLRQLNQPGQPDLVTEVLVLFRADAPARLAAINDAVHSGNGPALQRAAHALKGAAGTIGAHALHDLCKILEEMGKTGVWGGASAAVEETHREYAQLCEEIDHLL